MKTNTSAANRNIRLVSQGNEHRVVAAGVDLMRLTTGHLYMSGLFLIQDVRLHPEHPQRIANFISPWIGFAPRRHPDRVAVTATPTDRGLLVKVQPDTQGGCAEVTDTYEFVPDPETGGWLIERHCRIVLRRAVKAGDTALKVFPDPQGHPALWWEIDDPNFTGNFGPAVPMTNDWLGQYEPTCGPDTWRRHWRRRVEKEFYQETSGKLRTIRFHRGMLFALRQHNRRALPFRRGGCAGVLHTDGSGTVYEFADPQPIFGHICEWGFDTHFWRHVPGDPDTCVLPKGHVLETRYRLRELPPARMTELLRRASPVEPTAADWRQAEVPIYEEPVNRFAISWRDGRARDAFPWIPGVGASWDRQVGRRQSGSLRLEMPRAAINAGAHWTSMQVGPTNFMNPLAPGARYRLRGWVRLAPARGRTELGVPSISITFHTYQGPATFSPEVLPAKVFTGHAQTKLVPDRWLPLEVVTALVNGNVLGVTLGCHLHHAGTAWFTELAFTKLDE